MKSNLPLTGDLVAQVVKSFCAQPVRGDDTWETCSVGVATDSLVATDSSSAILIGRPALEHDSTLRKEALLEAERSKLYGDPVRIDLIPRNTIEGGEVRPMPPVSKIVRESLQSMKSLASLDPRALVAIGQVAQKAGAGEVELFQPADGEKAMLGFRFRFAPHQDHVDLFSEWTEMIEAQGVFVVRRFELPQAVETPELVEDKEAKPARRPSSKRPRGADPVAPESASEAEAEPAAVVVEELPKMDAEAVRERHGFDLPPLVSMSPAVVAEVDSGEHASVILEVLRQFNITARLACVHAGPAVSLYELSIPMNVRVRKVDELADNLQMALGASSVRVQAPIPGKKTIGVEVPNIRPRTVFLRELCDRVDFFDGPPLHVGIGVNVLGQPIYGDLATMPHLLIAGATNSGKSIGMASLLSSLLLRNTPQDLRFVMIDPKRVELTLFDGLPHLLCPVVTEVKDAPGVLRAVWREMDQRYDQLQRSGVRNIVSYNAKQKPGETMPYIVVVIDELADLMIQAKAEVETTIVRLSQLARAVGIHLVVATQRPSVDVVTGLIKANMPSRMAFAVASQVDSRTILDAVGAEKLLGRGDLLFWPIGASSPERGQGAYVSEEDVAKLVSWWKRYSPGDQWTGLASVDAEEADADDDLWTQAVKFARDRGSVSTSMLQRQFTIGFQRASRLIEEMERRGVVGPRDGVKPRLVLETGGQG